MMLFGKLRVGKNGLYEVGVVEKWVLSSEVPFDDPMDWRPMAWVWNGHFTIGNQWGEWDKARVQLIWAALEWEQANG